MRQVSYRVRLERLSFASVKLDGDVATSTGEGFINDSCRLLTTW